MPEELPYDNKATGSEGPCRTRACQSSRMTSEKGMAVGREGGRGGGGHGGGHAGAVMTSEN